MRVIDSTVNRIALFRLTRLSFAFIFRCLLRRIRQPSAESWIRVRLQLRGRRRVHRVRNRLELVAGTHDR